MLEMLIRQEQMWLHVQIFLCMLQVLVQRLKNSNYVNHYQLKHNYTTTHPHMHTDTRTNTTCIFIIIKTELITLKKHKTTSLLFKEHTHCLCTTAICSIFKHSIFCMYSKAGNIDRFLMTSHDYFN